jgi:23S rRNA (guanosine2251-2'-O)-methyltransferase
VKTMRLRIILHDIRSCHNVGSLFRTAEGLGVEHIYITGYTPYPVKDDDTRLPHIRTKLAKQINKTALDAENLVPWSQHDSVDEVIAELQADAYKLVALEQASDSLPLPAFRPTKKSALLLGREVEGIDDALLARMDTIVEIPMSGRKESFNVVQAAAMAMYQCTLVAPATDS